MIEYIAGGLEKKTLITDPRKVLPHLYNKIKTSIEQRRNRNGFCWSCINHFSLLHTDIYLDRSNRTMKVILIISVGLMNAATLNHWQASHVQEEDGRPSQSKRRVLAFLRSAEAGTSRLIDAPHPSRLPMWKMEFYEALIMRILSSRS